MATKCRARTKEGKLCKRKVRKAGMRCQDHKGMAEAGPRQPTARTSSSGKQRRSPGNRSAQRTPPPPQRTSRANTSEAQRNNRQQKRVAAAAEVCREVLTDGWETTVESRATNYVSERTWHGLFGAGRRNRCRNLARLATEILTGKKAIHDVIGNVVRRLVSLLGGSRFEQSLAQELAANLPLPWDAKVTATARGVQVTGIALCVAEGSDLTKCQCFIDLALEETKSRIKQILAAARDDWTRLAEFPPAQSTSP